ncbi:Lrp/AsnC family transcriptional regulator [Natrinema salsiterrestre]|uniref:Lrp/AsnC family transcriptional regulator n=1 Tax=Natrinema salsiterrestre TaxID=2950540 RepID=A0A9Q4L3J3_9EURY|nr:Lrp/AsnC family transcriptional regulator [Natrinema salsiterrestre]MDF9746203.1 Lrp/AsnC family transcriptional regulator [Natrinema salsiterrestre]
MNHTDATPDLDENDLDIIRELERNDEKNLEELADELDLSKSAIHYRLNQLKESGVIRNISADVDPRALGMSMVIITEVYVSHESGYADEIGDDLADLPGVQQVFYTMGDVDFMVVSRVQNHDQMNELIDEIVALEGVNETSSRFVMRELKNGNRILETMSEGMVDRVLETE